MILDKLKNRLNKTKYLSKTIEELGFTVRTHKILKRQGFKDVGDLVQLSWNDLAKLRGSVRKTVEEVKRVLEGLGLGLKKE